MRMVFRPAPQQPHIPGRGTDSRFQGKVIEPVTTGGYYDEGIGIYGDTVQASGIIGDYYSVRGFWEALLVGELGPVVHYIDTEPQNMGEVIGGFGYVAASHQHQCGWGW